METLEDVKKGIEKCEEALKKLKGLRDEMIQAETAKEHMTRLVLPETLKQAWASLTDINMITRDYYSGTSSCGVESSCIGFGLYLSFSDGRKFSFHDTEDSECIFMENKSYGEFGWGPSAPPRWANYLTISELWEAAQNQKDNEGKYICCAMAGLIYHAYRNTHILPWDLKRVLCDELKLIDR